MKYRLLLVVLALLTITSSSLADTKKKNVLSLKESITDNDIQYPPSFNSQNDMLKEWYNMYHETNSPIEPSDNQNYGSVSDAVYKERLQKLPTTIEMPFNQIVKSYIERYVVKGRSLVSQLLGMSPYYMPIFEAALERHQMPLELKYIPIIESALNPNAVSPAGAGGLWQFMPSTAKGHGMEVSNTVDERRDPYASSEKAALFFKKLYSTYHDWSLCIAAYNCGPGNVNKAIKRTGNDNADFWEIYNYLPKETRGYVPAFIAANYVMHYYKEHGITPTKTKPLIIDTVMVSKRVNFRQIAQALNIPVEEIRILNPQYRNEVIPGNVHPYVLALPNQHIYSYIKNEGKIKESTTDVENDNKGKEQEIDRNKFKDYDYQHSEMYTVKDGETLEDVARMYGMTVEDLILLNELKSNEVKPGKILFVSRNLSSTGNTNNNGYDDEDDYRYYNNSNDDNGRNNSDDYNTRRTSSNYNTGKENTGGYSYNNNGHSGRDSRYVPIQQRRKAKEDNPVPQRSNNRNNNGSYNNDGYSYGPNHVETDNDDSNDNEDETDDNDNNSYSDRYKYYDVSNVKRMRGSSSSKSTKEVRDDYSTHSNNNTRSYNDQDENKQDSDIDYAAIKKQKEEAEKKRKLEAEKKRKLEAEKKKKKEQELALKKKKEKEEAAEKKRKEEAEKKRKEEAKKKRKEEERRRAEAAKPTSHVVKDGSNLTKLAKQYGVSVDEIKRANGLKNDNIRAGQTLKIPKKGKK